MAITTNKILSSIFCLLTYYQRDVMKVNAVSSTFFKNTPGATSDRKLPSSSGAITQLDLEFIDCLPVSDTPDGTDDIMCEYKQLPVDMNRRTKLVGVDVLTECNDQVPPVGGFSINDFESGPVGGDSSGMFLIYVDVAEGGADVTRNPDGTYETRFCIMNELVDDRLGESFYTHFTQVKCKFTLNGDFEIYPILLEGTPTPVDFDEIEKGFGITYYICEPDPPYLEITTPRTYDVKDRLSVCLNTVADTTVIDSVVSYTLDQYNNGQTGPSEFTKRYIIDSIVEPGIAYYDCTLAKPGSVIAGSMCFIQIALAQDFFENRDENNNVLGEVFAVGTADLKIIGSLDDPSVNRVLHASHSHVERDVNPRDTFTTRGNGKIVQVTGDAIKATYDVKILLSSTNSRALNGFLCLFMMFYYVVVLISLFT